MDTRAEAIQSATDILQCMSISQIQQSTEQDEHLQYLKNIIVTGWPNTKDQLHINIRVYWSYQDDLAVIDGMTMKGRCIIIPEGLKQQALDQLNVNHMGIEKTKLLTCKSMYWVNLNNDIENHVQNCSKCLEFQQTQPKEKTIHHDILLGPWEVLGVDVFQLNNKNYLCVVDYHSKFLVIKRMEGLSAECLMTTVKIIYAEYSIPHRLMSDAGTISFQRSSKVSATVSTFSKQYHHCTTTKATDE